MKKITFNFSVDAWLEAVEIEANTTKEAIVKLHSMSLEELIENGCVHDFSVSNEDYEIEDEDLKELEGLLEEIRTDKWEMEQAEKERAIDEEDYQRQKGWFEADLDEIVYWLKAKAKELGIDQHKTRKELVEEIFKALEWDNEDEIKEELLSYL